MRVFISSTCFDLIDVRAELAEQLRSLGVTPVLSDDKLSDFNISPDINSIETCLLNVKSCDAVILILDRRYGPSLGSCGFDDISATHLEYRQAVEARIPVHAYVRDRLQADYTIWKRNRETKDVQFSWIDSKNHGLFELLKEHSQLQSDIPRSNWYSTFSNSIDLKAAIAKHLEEKILPRRLVEAIHQNRFPLFDIKVDAELGNTGTVRTINVRSSLTNVGGAPAFNYRVFWHDKEDECTRKDIIAAGQTILMAYILGIGPGHPGGETFLIAEYESPIGVIVRDRYRVGAHIQQLIMFSGGSLISRTFHRAPPMLLTIEGT